MVHAETNTQEFDDAGAGATVGSFGWTNWTGSGGLQGGTTNATTSISAPYSIYKAPTGANGGIGYNFASSSTGIMSVWMRGFEDANFESHLISLGNYSKTQDYSEMQIVFSRGVNGISCGQNSQEYLSAYTVGAWYEALIEWRVATNGYTEARCGYRTAGNPIDWSEYRGSAQMYGQVGSVKVYANANYPSLAMDNFYFATDGDYDAVSGIGNSQILAVQYPPYGTTTASTTFDIEYTYRNTDEYNGAKIFLRHQLNGTVYTYYDFFDDELLVLGSGSKEVTLLATGAYTLQINLCNIPDIGSPDCTTTGSGTSLFYAVASDGGIQTVITTGYADYVVYPPDSCDLNLNPFDEETFIVSDCMGYLMSPSTTTISRLDTLTVEDRFPFAYMYQIPVLISYLFQTSADNSSAGVAVTIGAWSFTFINQAMIASSPYTPIVRALLVIFLYVVSAITCYRKIIKLHDNVTTS